MSDQVLGGRFRLEQRLANDPLVEVWRGTDEQLRRDVVLKLLRPRWLGDEAVVERFRFEALAAAQLVHDHVASTFDVELADGVLFAVSEYVDGPTVEQLLANGPLDPVVVAALGAQVALGLEEAHAQGLVHRAVCPANLVVSSSGRLCIVDFGSVRSMDVDDALPDPIFPEPGVSDYWSPEQRGRREVDDRADVYSLGLVLWEALTGAPTPEPRSSTGGPGRRVRDWLGGDQRAALLDILEQATAPRPEDRPEAARLAEELREICGSRPQEQLEPLVRELATPG